MDFLVTPTALTSGTVTVPGDKSISHRALILAAIANGPCNLTGFLAGEDCLATLAALEAMGIEIGRRTETSLVVHGAGMHGLQRPAQNLYLGNSGTGMRLLAGLLCGQPFNTVLTGDDSLSGRPMKRVIEPLAGMGARIDSRRGLPPLTVYGGRALSGITYALPVASAQVKSAILLAALYAQGDTAIFEPAVTRDHTERMLRAMGIELESDAGHIRLAGRQTVQRADVEVPADLSSAAFLVLAALLAPDCELIIEGVGVNPTRTGFIDILREMGADISLDDARMPGHEPVADLRIRSSELQGIDVDPGLVSLAIDEFPLLFIAAAAANGSSRFSGVGELRVKESDRIAAMANGLRQLGIRVDESSDGAVVHGGRLNGGRVDSRADHRIAMSFAVAGTIADSAVRILRTDSVDTSFPGFAECLRSIGADITSTGISAA